MPLSHKITTKTTYPCCGGPARFEVWRSLPTQLYLRRCAACGQRWQVTRNGNGTDDVQVDQMTWEQLYQRPPGR